MIDKRERPILFSPPMVRAILRAENPKAQTRRVVKTDPTTSTVSRGGRFIYLDDELGLSWRPYGGAPLQRCPPEIIYEYCPYGKPGDLLWVREAWRTGKSLDPFTASEIEAKYRDAGYKGNGACCPIWYTSDGSYRRWGENDGADFGEPGRYRHGRFMARWASRISLEVTDVRVQRVQEIGEEDARAEGIGGDWHQNNISHPELGVIAAFRSLWDSINGKTHPWSANPWVWAVSFRRVA